jgi:hypothetical protein
VQDAFCGKCLGCSGMRVETSSNLASTAHFQVKTRSNRWQPSAIRNICFLEEVGWELISNSINFGIVDAPKVLADAGRNGVLTARGAGRTGILGLGVAGRGVGLLH